MSNKNQSVLAFVQAAIFAGLSIVLSLLPTNIGSSLTISLGMIPLVLISLKLGLKMGLVSGLIWGLLHFVLGKVYYLGPIQVVIEYVIAYLFAGFGGLCAKQFHLSLKKEQVIIWASFLATFARFFWHFVAGFIYWGEYAPEGWSPVFFSLVMNGASALLTALATAFILVIIYKRYPKLFQRDYYLN